MDGLVYDPEYLYIAPEPVIALLVAIVKEPQIVPQELFERLKSSPLRHIFVCALTTLHIPMKDRNSSVAGLGRLNQLRVSI